MVSTRKTRRTRKADEEYLESLSNGQEVSEAANLLGVATAAAKALEVIPTAITTANTDSGDDSMDGGAKPLKVVVPPYALQIRTEDPDWEPDLEGAEVLDDPVRMYLREIGRVQLLTSQDERVLARSMEGGKHLDALEEELRNGSGRPVPAWEMSIALLNRLVDAEPLVTSLGRRLGICQELTLFPIITHREVRDAIDVLLDPELMERVAGDLDWEMDEVGKAIIQLSLDSWVLPPESANVLGDCSLSRLRVKMQDENETVKLRPVETRLRYHIIRIRTEAFRSQQHLTEANLRLVVSVAKKYIGRGMSPPRPHSGRQHRPHSRRREVRLPQGLQVQHLRHLVDSTGHHQGHRRPGQDNPHPRPHGGDHQQAHAAQPPPASGLRTRAQPGGDWPRDGPDARARRGDNQNLPGACVPPDSHRRGGGQPSGRLHRRPERPPLPPTPPPSSC